MSAVDLENVRSKIDAIDKASSGFGYKGGFLQKRSWCKCILT